MPLDARPLSVRDQLARTTALTALNRTLLVEAGAGSGKTSVLAGRVVMLLASGRAPAEIAAISFTEFSASELRERIAGFVDDLLTGKTPPDLLAAFPSGNPTDEQLARLAEANASLDSICCLTIHGFCRTLLTPYPVEAGIDPGAAMLDQGSSDLLFEDVYMSWLRARLSGVQQPGDVFAAIYLTDQKAADTLLRDLTEQLLGHRSARVAEHDPVVAELLALGDAAAALRSFLGGLPFPCPGDVEALVRQFEALVASGHPVGSSEALTLPWMLRLPIPDDCAIDKGKEFKAKFSTKGAWRTAFGGGRTSHAAADVFHGQALALYEAFRDAHIALRDAAAGRILHLLGAEARAIVAAYTKAKTDAAVLDFGDLLEKSRILLAGNVEVRRALGQRHPVVLVDEFQDTDPDQLEIFWRLCSDPPPGNPDAEWTEWVPRPGALFLVGDPKQAIYRFRGADLAAYERAFKLLEANDKDSVLRIFRNFRSRPGILEWVNGQFSGCFSVEGQAKFAKLETDVVDSLAYQAVASLPFQVEDGTKADAVRDEEARRVAELCKLIVGNVDVRQRDGTTRKCEPSDIALLAPASTELWRYERELEDQGLSVATQAGKGFFRRQEIQDLIALTRALADRRDRLALGALLRGPLVGLTDEQLLDAVAEQTEVGQDAPQVSLDLDLGKVSNPLLRETLQKLSALSAMRRSVTAHVLLCEAVELLSVRPILRQRGLKVAERALANLDLFLEMARPYDVRGLRSFSDQMRTLWEEARKEQDGRPDAGQFSVSLVTMHSAKGLEWSVVIPVNTAGRAMDMVTVAYDRTANVLRMGAFGCHPVGCRDALDEERRQQRFERQRLWYVACTRARDLFLMPQFEGKVDRLSWWKLVDFAFDGLSPFDPAFAPAEIPTAEEAENNQDRAKFGAEAEIVMGAKPRIRRETPHLTEGEAVQEGMVIVRDDLEGQELQPVRGSLERGLILHKLLEEVLTGETLDALGALAARGAELADQLGVQGPKRPDPEELARAVRRGLDRPEIASIRTKLRAEWPVASAAFADGEEVATLGVADAVAIEHDGTTSCIVDWKSDVEPSEAAIAQYRGQVRKYLRASGAPEGLLVFLTSGDVDKVSAFVA